VPVGHGEFKEKKIYGTKEVEVKKKVSEAGTGPVRFSVIKDKKAKGKKENEANV
jgi:hypothetical protein